MLRCITDYVEKTPFQISVSWLRKPVLLKDIIYGASGIGAGVLAGLLVTPLLGARVLLFFGLCGMMGGLMIRRFSPGKVGWRNFFKAMILHQIKSKARDDGPRGKGGTTYLSMWRPAPMFAMERKYWEYRPSSIIVGRNYSPRADGNE